MPFEGTAMPASGLVEELTLGPLPVAVRRVAEVLESVPGSLQGLYVTFSAAEESTYVTVQVSEFGRPVAERLALAVLLADGFGLPAPEFGKRHEAGWTPFTTPNLDWPVHVYAVVKDDEAKEAGTV